MRSWVGRGRMVTILTVLVLAGTLIGWRLAFGAGSANTLTVAFSSKSTGKVAAPDFHLKDLQGQSVSLAQFKGRRPVLLEFWATWCPYCMAARPEVARLRQKISRKELAILGINVGAGGDSLEHVKLFEARHPSPYPVLYDKGSAVSDSYGVEGIPLFIVVNKRGDVVYRAHQLPDNIEKYLR